MEQIEGLDTWRQLHSERVPTNIGDLCQLVESCTVKVYITDKEFGTGFFIAPQLVITCYHVVKDHIENLQSIKIVYNSNKYEIQEIISPVLPGEDDSEIKYPDLILFRIQINISHNCVKTTNKRTIVGSNLYIFGRTNERKDGEAMYAIYEGPIYIDDTEIKLTDFEDENQKKYLLKFRDTLIKPGASGSPILNLTSGEVCAVGKWSFDIYSNRGGAGIPIKEARRHWMDLIKENEDFHHRSNVWSTATDNQLSRLRSNTYALSKTFIDNNREAHFRLIIEGEFSSFSDKMRLNILKSFAKLLKIKTREVKYHSKEEGSIILHVSIPSNSVDLLSNLTVTGLLYDAKIKFIEPIFSENSRIKNNSIMPVPSEKKIIYCT